MTVVEGSVKKGFKKRGKKKDTCRIDFGAGCMIYAAILKKLKANPVPKDLV